MHSKTYYFDSNDKHCPLLLGHRLADIIKNYRQAGKIVSNAENIVILCIGSDRSTGDSLGPLIGYKLSKTHYPGLNIYGTLKNPVHAVNLSDVMDKINMEHPDSLIIAIDASVGNRSHIGYITLSCKPLKPGLGVNKELPAVGNICITGIVNFQSILDNMILQTTRLDTVMELADCISSAIIKALKTIDVPLYS